MNLCEHWAMKSQITGVMKSERVENKKVRGIKSTLYASIRPLVYVFRIFGHAPYEFDDNGQLVPASIYVIFSLICISIYSYAVYNVLIEFLSHTWDDRPILAFVERSKLIINYAIAVFDIIVSFQTRKKFAKIWNSIQNYDKAVQNVCHTRNEKSTRLWVWSIIIFNLIFWLAMNQTEMILFDEGWIRNLSYMITYIGSAIAVTKFSGITLILSQRFDHLSIIAKRNTPSGSRWRYAGPSLNICTIENLYDNLMSVADDLKSIYSWPMIFWFGNLTLHTISDFYRINVAKRSRMVYRATIWVINFIWQLWLLTSSCHFASEKANRMGYIMLEWKRWLHYRYKNTEMGPSFFNMIHRKLSFSAAGCFNVDFSLLLSIANLTTSLLVILIQMK